MAANDQSLAPAPAGMVSMRQDWANADMQAPVRRAAKWRLMKSCNIRLGWDLESGESGERSRSTNDLRSRTSEPGADVE